MAEVINPIRHMSVFDPDKFGDQPVHVIGVGATGSRIALGLAKLGVRNLHLWDFDKVEEHNVANQVYGLKDIGEFKVNALQKIIADQTGSEPIAHNAKVDGKEGLEGYVFLLTDSMESRKEIWEGGIRANPDILAMVETRMGRDSGRVYWVEPFDEGQCEKWEKTLCEDEEAETSLCGTAVTVGATAEVISGMAQWAFVRAFQQENEDLENKENEVVVAINPATSFARNF